MMQGMPPPGPPGAYMPGPYMQPMPYPPGMPPPNGMHWFSLLIHMTEFENIYSHVFTCDGSDAS